MAFILTSFLHAYTEDESGVRYANEIEDTNLILTNIKKFLNGTDKIVFVANDRYAFIKNDQKAMAVFGGFKKSRIDFKKKVILDNRNKQNSKEILEDANLIILSGGKCFRQINFFNEIGLKEILANFKGLVIGVSAGSMNLCETVENFPEEIEDINEPRWLTGLGLCDDIVIPHFEGKTKSYQFDVPIKVVENYVIPASLYKTFVGLDNDAYILVDNDGNKKYYGNACHIENGKVKYDIDVECDDEKAEEGLFSQGADEIVQGDVCFEDVFDEDVFAGEQEDFSKQEQDATNEEEQDDDISAAME